MAWPGMAEGALRDALRLLDRFDQVYLVNVPFEELFSLNLSSFFPNINESKRIILVR